MERFIVDRIEENFVVCEDNNKNFINIHINNFINNFKFEVKPGDVIIFKNNVYLLDSNSKNNIRKLNFKLQNNLFE